MVVARAGRAFISYSSADSAEAFEICRKVEERGIGCAIAPRDVPLGANYADWIGDAIVSSSAFVLVVSNASHRSRAVANEIELAFNEGKPIYPVRIDPIEKTDLSSGIRFFISSRQMFDAIRPIRASSLDRFSKAIARDLLAGGNEQPAASPASPDQARFRQLWTRMDKERRSFGWLWEAALRGPLWPFHRGMTALGFGLMALLTLLVLAAGLAQNLAEALTVLVLGWLAISVYLAVLGAALLRRFVDGDARRILSGGGAAFRSAALGATMLAASLGLCLALQSEDRGGHQSPTVVVSKPVTPPAVQDGGVGAQRREGNSVAWRERQAQAYREAEAAVVGYVVGRSDEQQRQAEADQAALDAQAAEMAAEEVDSAM